MSIRMKILAVVLAVAVLGTILGITGFVSVQLLTNQVGELREYSKQSDDFTSILSAHYTWRNGLTGAVLTGSEFTGSLDPTGCALGKFLSSEEAANITDGTLNDLLAKVVAPHNHIHLEASGVIDCIAAEDMDGAVHQFTNNIIPSFDEVIATLLAISARYGELVDEKDEEVSSIESATIAIIIVLIVVALAASVFLAMLISGNISKPLISLAAFMKKAGNAGDIVITPNEKLEFNKYGQRKDEVGECFEGACAFVDHVTHIAKELETVADGDLTHDVRPISDKDIMGISLADMLENLNGMFGNINTSTYQVATGAKHIADGSQILAQGSTEQANSIQQLSESMAEIAERTKENAEMAGEAAALADTIKTNAEKGTRQMDDMMGAVKEINQASQDINKVIKVIDDIAFQTNILALNAAVEAARAGQHGKGFAVVAEEVRSLASKSAEAAKDTGSLIANSLEKAELGSRIAGETAESLAEIVSGINESTRIVSEIAHSSDGQSEGIAQMNKSVEAVARVVQQNTATAQQSAAASQQMNGQSDILQQLVSQFKLKSSNAAQRTLQPAGTELVKY